MDYFVLLSSSVNEAGRGKEAGRLEGSDVCIVSEAPVTVFSEKMNHGMNGGLETPV